MPVLRFSHQRHELLSIQNRISVDGISKLKWYTIQRFPQTHSATDWISVRNWQRFSLKNVSLQVADFGNNEWPKCWGQNFSRRVFELLDNVSEEFWWGSEIVAPQILKQLTQEGYRSFGNLWIKQHTTYWKIIFPLTSLMSTFKQCLLFLESTS